MTVTSYKGLVHGAERLQAGKREEVAGVRGRGLSGGGGRDAAAEGGPTRGLCVAGSSRLEGHVYQLTA